MGISVPDNNEIWVSIINMLVMAQTIGEWIGLNLHSHDLRVPVGSLCLPQCNVGLPGVLNCMSGRLSGFPSLYWRYLCISYEHYKYWQNAKVNPSSNTQQKVSGKFPVICSMFCRKSAGSWHREHHAFTPPNPLTVKYSSITVSQLLPGIPVELTNYGDSYNIAPIFGMFARNIN